MKFLHVFSLVAVLLLSACGGASGSPGAATSRLDVEMSEFMFSPDNYTVPAGQEITLNLSNDGAIVHEFLVLQKGASANPPFDHAARAADILFQAKLDPGKSQSFTFTLPEAGTYEVVCAIPGHIESGMVGSITAK